MLLLLALFSPSAGGRQLEVRPSAQGKVDAKPGSLLSLGIRVSNLSSKSQTVDPQILLPSGWRLIAPEGSFELRARAGEVRLITFSIPPQTPAGTYQIRYAAKDRDSPPNTAEALIEVSVLRVHQLEMRLSAEPRFVVAGTEYVSSFLLSNKGNAMVRVKLDAKSGNDFITMLDSPLVRLSAREVRQIDVKVLTDSRIGDKVQNTLELYATLVDDSTVVVRGSSVVEVVPRSVKSEERYLEFPMSLRLRGVGENNRTAGQIEIAGFGTLSQDRSDRLEFLIRAPETQSLSVLGQRDEYKVSYRAPGVELYGGDWNYALTPLTEMGRYGAGAGGKITLGKLTVGGYYNETRFYEPKQRQSAAYIAYKFLEGLQGGVNYLKKAEQTQAEITTLRSILEPFADTGIDFEYGLASKEGEKSKAYSVRAEGKQRWISYDMRYVHADAGFPGYYKDLNLQMLGINFQPWANLRVESYYRNEERNLARDTNLVYAPKDRYYQLGIGYSNILSLYFRSNVQEDALPLPKYRRQENVVQARLGYSFPDFSIFANADFGSTEDKIGPSPLSYPSNRYALNANFSPFAGHNYNASLEFSKDQNIFTAEFQERISASFGAFVFLGQATQLQFNLYSSRIKASFEQTYSLVEMTLEHVFPFAHKVTVRTRQSFITPSTDEKETAYHLEYAIPLALPLKRLTTTGQLSGRIIYEDGSGVENVLINAGTSAAVSDRNGNFVFPSLKPDVVYLQIDRASMGLDKVTLQPMPMQVVVRGGEDTHVDISVIRSARIEGEIKLFGLTEQTHPDSTPRFVELHGQPGVFLELSNNSETLRRVSDNRGRFMFTDLRPGRWTLKAVGGEVPPYHNFERESFDLDLRPGGKETLVFRIFPRKRQIKILQEGGVVQEQRQEQKTKPPIVSRPAIAPTPRAAECLVVYKPSRKGYVIQLSSWQSKEKARILARRAEESFPKYKSLVEEVNIPKLGRRYRVQIGIFKTRKEAERECVDHRLISKPQ